MLYFYTIYVVENGFFCAHLQPTTFSFTMPCQLKFSDNYIIVVEKIVLEIGWEYIH